MCITVTINYHSFHPQDLKIFIIEIHLVEGEKPETFTVDYIKNSVTYLATNDEESKLKSKLEDTGFVLLSLDKSSDDKK